MNTQYIPWIISAISLLFCILTYFRNGKNYNTSQVHLDVEKAKNEGKQEQKILDTLEELKRAIEDIKSSMVDNAVIANMQNKIESLENENISMKKKVDELQKLFIRQTNIAGGGIHD